MAKTTKDMTVATSTYSVSATTGPHIMIEVASATGFATEEEAIAGVQRIAAEYPQAYRCMIMRMDHNAAGKIVGGEVVRWMQRPEAN